MKFYKLFLVAAFATTALSGCMTSLSLTPAFPTPILSLPTLSLPTPDLIERDFVDGKITEEQRTLYLAYALTGDDNLPAQYHSNIYWGGTSISIEVHVTVTSKETVCKFGSFTRNELVRVLGDEVVSCDNSNNGFLAITLFIFCALATFAIANRKKIINFLKFQ